MAFLGMSQYNDEYLPSFDIRKEISGFETVNVFRGLQPVSLYSFSVEIHVFLVKKYVVCSLLCNEPA
jgi:hypothetical protein